MRPSPSVFVLATTLLVLICISNNAVVGFQVGKPTNAAFPLHASSLTEPKEAAAKKPGPKGQKKKNRPKTRQGRNKQFLMKKWKSQQADQKKQKQRKPQSQLVSAIGVDLSTIQQPAQPKRGNRNKNAKRIQPKKKPVTTRKDLLPWSSLRPGSKISGKVIKLLPYGALIQTKYDIPGKTVGCVMLHESQMKPGMELKVGQTVNNVRVLSINRDNSKVAVSLQTPSPKGRATTVRNLQVGDEVLGKVVRLKQYGAFVDVGLKRNALLHISRMSMYKVTNLTDYVTIGQSIPVRILRLQEGDIAVSMLSSDNDEFVDRRDMQRKRIAIWETVVNGVDDEVVANAKRELLEVDRQIWDQFMKDSLGPRSGEV